MTTEELNTIVQAVIDKINEQVIDFDVVQSVPESTDLLSAVRPKGDGTYQGVTLKWDNVANAVTREAKGYRDEAASAKTNVENMKASVEQTVSGFNTLAEQKKAEVQGVYKTDLNELKGDLVDYNDTTMTLIDAHFPINLFDKTKVSYGYISNGVFIPHKDYAVSDYIECKENDIFSMPSKEVYGDSKVNVPIYDSNETFLGNDVATESNGILTVTITKSGAKYFRFKSHPYSLNTDMVVKGNNYPSEYSEYFTPYFTPKNQHTESINNPLYGKKLCCDGDSIIYGAGNSGKSFADIIAERNGMILNKIAVSGGTICSGTTDGSGNNKHWISESIGTLDTDGDYYIFDGWINDCNSITNLGAVSWGYENTLDTTTFCGAFEQCCKTLITTYKGKKVGYIFVHRIWQPTDTFAQSFIDKMIEILKKWGIPYLNLMEDIPSLNLINDLKSTYTNNGDGWHPNKLGYEKYYVDKIEAWLKTL